MILRLLDPSAQPYTGFIYTDEQTGYESHGKTLPDLIAIAKAHRIGNGLAVPADFAARIETQLCTRLPDTLCAQIDGVRDTSCVHRGERTRLIECSNCCGSVKAIILACAVHGECTQFGKDVGIKQCWNCRERKSVID